MTGVNKKWIRAADVSVTLTLPASQLVVVTDDHGGYKGGYCVVCMQHGWANAQLGESNGVHKKDCPVLKALQAAKVNTGSAI